jgi:Fe-S cluster assembly iron-binding protein IscA
MFTITEKAITELKNIVNGPEMPEKAAIRVFAQSGGCCSTHHLGIEIADLAAEQLKAEDFKGLQVVIEEDAREIAQNATIDFYDHPENPGFKVLWQKDQNGGCGCH